ncbi:MAG: methyltransferase [Gammaproteobacteria bacterium]|nr:methyltransferase [Gammaproteobacteria bacterium]
MKLQKNVKVVNRFARLLRVGAWVQNLPNRMTPAPFRVMQIGSAFWQSRVLYTAARLDIATLLADRTLPAESIAAELEVDADALRRLLRMLTAMGIFREMTSGMFANNTLSNCLRQDNAQNVRAMILMHNSPAMSAPWYEQLEPAIRSGQVPFELAHGEDLFTYMDHHADFDQLFAAAMDSVESLSGDSFARDFDWSRFARIIDVGGSKGAKSAAILRVHPHLQALVCDRAGIIEGATSYWKEHDPAMLTRLSFKSTDVLQTIPASRDDSDIHLLSAVLHGFDDGDCVRILGNLAQASAAARSLSAILEIVMPESQADLSSASFDMQMFVGTHGRERTLTQWQALIDQAGMVLVEVVGLQTFAKILVIKAAEVLYRNQENNMLNREVTL